MVPRFSLWFMKRLLAFAVIGFLIAGLGVPPSLAADPAGAEKAKRAAILKHLLAVFRSDIPGEEPIEASIWETWLRRTGELPPDFDRLPANAFPPDLLTFQNGKVVTDACQWAARRQEIRGVLDQYMLGQWPPPPAKIAIKYEPSRHAVRTQAL